MGKKKIDDFISDLSSDDEIVRRSGAIKLGNYEDPLAISALKMALTDTSASVRFYAKKSLKKLEKSMGKDEIDKNIPMDDNIKEELSEIKRFVENKDLKGLSKFFNSKNGIIRASAISQLPQVADINDSIDGQKVKEILLEMIHDSHSRVVANSVEVIEKLNFKEAEAELLKLLFHEDSRVKANVAHAIYNLYSDREDLQNMALARLGEIIKSDKPWIRQSAVYVLSSIGSEEALEILKSAQNDKENIVKNQVKQAIQAHKKITKDGVIKEIKPKSNANNISTVVVPVTDDREISSRELIIEKFDENKKKILIGCSTIFLFIFVIIFIQATWEVLSERNNNKIVKKNIKSHQKISKKLNVKKVVRNRSVAQDKNVEKITPEEKEAVTSASKGISYLRNMKFELAIDEFKKSLKNIPDNNGIKILLATSYLELARNKFNSGKNKEAEELLLKSRKYSETAAERTLYAKIKFIESDYNGALSAIKEAVKLDKKSGEAFFLFGEILEKKGEFKKASIGYRRAVNIDKTNYKYLLFYGRALAKIGKIDDGLQNIIKSVEMNPVEFSYKQLIEFANKYNRPKAAIEAYKMLLINFPDNKEYLEGYGDLLLRTGIFSSAIDIYKKLIKHDKRNSDILYKIGLAYQGYGQVDEMEKYFKLAIRYRKDFFEARYSLGTVQLYAGEIDEGLKNLNYALKLKKDNSEIRIILSNVYMDKRNYSKVIKLLKVVSKKDKYYKEAALVLGQAYFYSAKPEMCKKYFDDFIKLEGKNSKRTALVEKFLKKIRK